MLLPHTRPARTIAALLTIAATLSILACSDTQEPTPTRLTIAPIATLAPINTEAPAQTPEPTTPPTPQPAQATVETQEPTPVPTPADTPSPSPTTAPPTWPAPTTPAATAAPPTKAAPTKAAPQPTNTPTAQPPAATSAPPKEPPTGAIAPLPIGDTEALLAELSPRERDCIQATGQMQKMDKLLTTGEPEVIEEAHDIVMCLEEETLLRAYVTSVAQNYGELSAETSACLRAGLEGVGIRQTLIPDPDADPMVATIGAMTILTVNLTCLNEEEWNTIAPEMGISPEERQAFLCISEGMGGPEGLARAMTSDDESGLMEFFQVAVVCGIQDAVSQTQN